MGLGEYERDSGLEPEMIRLLMVVVFKRTHPKLRLLTLYHTYAILSIALSLFYAYVYIINKSYSVNH